MIHDPILHFLQLSISSHLLIPDLSMTSLTKEELRQALISHGVTDLPPMSAMKEELVSLYEEHVAPTAKGSTDFSSDDEVDLKSSPRKRASTTSSASSKKADAGASNVVEELDIDALDDDELFEKLKEIGIDVGPVVASTRPFYQKKLAMVLRRDTRKQDIDALDDDDLFEKLKENGIDVGPIVTSTRPFLPEKARNGAQGRVHEWDKW